MGQDEEPEPQLLLMSLQLPPAVAPPALPIGSSFPEQSFLGFLDFYVSSHHTHYGLYLWHYTLYYLWELLKLTCWRLVLRTPARSLHLLPIFYSYEYLYVPM